MDLFTDDQVELYQWKRTGPVPYFCNILHHKPGLVRFHGYFYREPEIFPIERILHTSQGKFHIEIIMCIVADRVEESEESERRRDSTDVSDEEVGTMTFFNTHDIELHYRILSELDTSDAYKIANDRCISLIAAEERRNQWHKQKREWDEWEFEIQFNRNLTFTAGPSHPSPLTPSSPVDAINKFEHCDTL